MANRKPPEKYAGAPVLTVLPATTVLFRIHLEKYQAHEFNPEPCHRYYGGGRFDSTLDDCYPFLYAGESDAVAIAETLLRDLPADNAGVLQIPRGRVDGRRLSAVVMSADLELVSLRSAADLAAVSQDPWLTTCDPQFYPQARHWGHWIRSHAPTAAGYVWMSHREPTQQAYVLFGDRVPAGTLATAADPALLPGDLATFDSPAGRRALRRRLSAYNVVLSRR